MGLKLQKPPRVERYLYIGVYNEFVKIGVSIEPEKRCSKLELDLIWRSPFPSGLALDWERKVLTALQKHQVVGEYFAVDRELARQLCEDAMRAA